jgi:hypothetical protein
MSKCAGGAQEVTPARTNPSWRAFSFTACVRPFKLLDDDDHNKDEVFLAEGNALVIYHLPVPLVFARRGGRFELNGDFHFLPGQEWSPEQILGKLKKSKVSGSVTNGSINIFWQTNDLVGDLYKHLHCQKQRPKRYDQIQFPSTQIPAFQNAF